MGGVALFPFFLFRGLGRGVAKRFFGFLGEIQRCLIRVYWSGDGAARWSLRGTSSMNTHLRINQPPSKKGPSVVEKNPKPRSNYEKHLKISQAPRP